MPVSNAANLRKQIFGACRDLGIDADVRRDLQLRVTGKSSLTNMSAADMQLVVNNLKDQGWKPKAKPRHPAAQRKDQRFVFVLWKLLAAAGVVSSGRKPLRAFIASQNFAAKYGDAETDPNMMSAERCYDVIEALKAVARRNGVEVERR